MAASAFPTTALVAAISREPDASRCAGGARGPRFDWVREGEREGLVDGWRGREAVGGRSEIQLYSGALCLRS